MRQTLFHIPAQVAGLPLFGFGLLAALWAVWTLAYAAWQWKRSGLTGELLGSLGMMVLVELAILFVSPNLLEVDQNKQPIGIAIRGYGVMLLLGIVSGVALTAWRARRAGVGDDVVYSLALWVFVAGMVGARAFFVIEYWKNFQRDTLRETLGAIVNVTQGGLVVFGAFLGATAALVIFARKHRLPVLALADLSAPGMALGLAFGRVGCFFNGCCFGDVCTLPWSVEFPETSPPYSRQVEQGRVFGFLLVGKPDPTRAGVVAPLIASVEPGSPAAEAGLAPDERIQTIVVPEEQKDGSFRPVVQTVTTLKEAQAALLAAARTEGYLPLRMETDRGRRTVPLWPRYQSHSQPIHPTQIYAAIDALLVTLLLLAFEPLRTRDGQTFALLITIHPVSRFLLEVIRIDEPAMFGTGLSISQNISVLMLAAAAGLWWWIERRPKGLSWPQVVSGQAV
jgi:phosphatidylglycerol---prolipoprotein diacylglyceryl transferase